MSMFQYNGITLPYPYHTSFSQESVFESSDTDKLYTKTDATCQCVINTDYIATIGGGAAGGPAEIMSTIRAKLLQPRKALSITFNGTNLVPAQPAGKTVDAKNGPHPMSCSYQLLTNTTFLMSFRIVTYQAEGSRGELNTTALSDRWTESIEFDAGSYGTRRRDGVVIISSSNPAGQQAKNIQNQLAVVGIPKGFVRQSSRYEVSPDGLELRFSVVDQEKFYMPPDPAYEAAGQYKERSPKMGAFRWAEMNVRLKGRKDVKQGDLLNTAAGVCASKLLMQGGNIAGGGPGGALVANAQGFFARLEETVFTISNYENEVEVYMRAMLPPYRQAIKDGVAGVLFEAMVATPRGSIPPTPSPLHYRTGTSDFLPQAAAFFDPDFGKTRLQPETGQLTPGTIPGTGNG